MRSLADPELRDPEIVRDVLKGAPWADHQGPYAVLASWILAVSAERAAGERELEQLRQAIATERTRRRAAEARAADADQLRSQIDQLRALEADLEQRNPASTKD